MPSVGEYSNFKTDKMPNAVPSGTDPFGFPIWLSYSWQAGGEEVTPPDEIKQECRATVIRVIGGREYPIKEVKLMNASNSKFYHPGIKLEWPADEFKVRFLLQVDVFHHKADGWIDITTRKWTPESHGVRVERNASGVWILSEGNQWSKKEDVNTIMRAAPRDNHSIKVVNITPQVAECSTGSVEFSYISPTSTWQPLHFGVVNCTWVGGPSQPSWYSKEILPFTCVMPICRAFDNRSGIMGVGFRYKTEPFRISDFVPVHAASAPDLPDITIQYYGQVFSPRQQCIGRPIVLRINPNLPPGNLVLTIANRGTTPVSLRAMQTNGQTCDANVVGAPVSWPKGSFRLTGPLQQWDKSYALGPGESVALNLWAETLGHTFLLIVDNQDRVCMLVPVSIWWDGAV